MSIDSTSNLSQEMLGDNVSEYSTDQLLLRSGRFGLFQCLGFLFSMVNFTVDGALIYNLGFLTLMPDYICGGFGAGDKGEFHCSNAKTCEIRESGVGYFYVNWQNSTSVSNWVQELDLMCAPQATLGLFGAVYFFGVVLSNLFLSRVGDLFGRLFAIRWSMLATVVLFGALCFFPSSSTKLFYLVLFGFGLTFSMRATSSFLYVQEIFAGKDGTMVATVLNIADSLNMSAMGLYFYFVSKQWQYYFYFWFGLLLLSFMATFFLPESPTYLIDQGQFQEARSVLNFICRVNSRPPLHPRHELISAQVRSELFSGLSSHNPTQESKSLKQLLSTRTKLQNIFAISMILGAASFSYNIVNFYVKYFPGSLYKIVLIVNCAEISAVLTSGLTATKYGSKLTEMIYFCISALFSTFIVFQGDSYSLLLLATIFFTKFGITGTFNIAFVLVPEYFEPSFRSTVFGIANVLARSFSIMSSLVAEMRNPWPMLIIAIVSYVAVGVTMLLSKEQGRLMKGGF